MLLASSAADTEQRAVAVTLSPGVLNESERRAQKAENGLGSHGIATMVSASQVAHVS